MCSLLENGRRTRLAVSSEISLKPGRNMRTSPPPPPGAIFFATREQIRLYGIAEGFIARIDFAKAGEFNFSSD